MREYLLLARNCVIKVILMTNEEMTYQLALRQRLLYFNEPTLLLTVKSGLKPLRN